MDEKRRLGNSPVTVSAMGVGVWAWGDTGYWGYGTNYSRADVEAAYRVSLEAGISFFDTAEVYGNGNSEKLLGWCTRQDSRPVEVASKFAPLPTRFSANALRPALDASLNRLKMDSIDLYQIHWPFTLIKLESLMDSLAAAVQAGKIRAVGVSNYTAKQMHQAHQRLARYDVPLASNQVHYSLLHRQPETNGVLQACRDLNVSLIAYTPLEQGVLTSRYASGQASQPSGMRRFSKYYRAGGRQKIQPILDTLSGIAADHQKSLEQVALNWLLNRDELVIPIPGAKTGQQARSNAGALGWRLSQEEMAHLDRISA